MSNQPAAQTVPPALLDIKPQFYRFSVGGIECTAVSDGMIPTPRLPGFEGSPSFKPSAIPDAPSLMLLQLSCLLVNMPGFGLVLMDSGFGRNVVINGQALPSVGRLLGSLKAAGVAPEEIKAVLISHIHPDHVGGLYDETGAKCFPNASYHVAAEELAFWSRDPLDLSAAASPPPVKQRMGEAARRMLGFAGGDLKIFKAGDDVLPGIASMLLAGHSPGQAGFIISSGTEKLIFTGDAIASPVTSIETPAIPNLMDMDPELAAATRQTLIRLLAQPGWRSFTPHFPWPSLGRVKADADHMFWEPD